MTQATPATPRPPAGLKPSTREWFRAVVREWELEAHHIRLLSLAAQAFDEAQAARAIVRRQGLIVKTPTGFPRPNPAIRIANEAAALFARCLRELDLDVAPPADAKRPPALLSLRGGRAS